VNFVDKSAKNPCSEFYPGKKAFSEKESQAIKAFMDAHKDEVKFVINFHSNGNSSCGHSTGDIPMILSQELQEY